MIDYLVRTVRRDAPVAGHALHATGIWVGRRGPFVGGFRELRSALSIAVYQECHAGQPVDPVGGPMPKGLARDRAVEAEITAVLAGSMRLVNARLLAFDPGAATCIVDLPEAKVRVESDRIVGDLVVGSQVTVRLEAGRPAISPGFYYVQGRREIPADREVTQRLYVHLTDVSAAGRALGAVVQALNAHQVWFHAKVLSTADAYPRRDALVVYLFDHDAGNREAQFAVLAALQGEPALGVEVSLFARRLRPGIAAACPQTDPRPGRQALSFGQHRAAAVADGVARWALDPELSLEAEVRRSLSDAHIDPDHPWDNLSPRVPVEGTHYER